MKKEQIIILLVSFFLGMLLLNVVKNVCGCNIKEGFLDIGCLNESCEIDDPTTANLGTCNFYISGEAVNQGYFNEDSCVDALTGNFCNNNVNFSCPNIENLWDQAINDDSNGYCGVNVLDDNPDFPTRYTWAKFSSEASANCGPPPVDCQGEWQNMPDQTCSKDCDGGTITQQYSITQVQVGSGAECEAGANQTKIVECNTQPCPINCSGSWGEWSGCTVECDGGTQTRTYSITTDPLYGGIACPNPTTETQECNTQPCLINCSGSWGEWSTCPSSPSCDTSAQKTRIYTVNEPASGGGSQCSFSHGQEQRQDCPVDSTDACGVCGGDGSSCTGCTDPTACNYDNTASINDADSCIPRDSCNRCPPGTGTPGGNPCGNNSECSINPQNDGRVCDCIAGYNVDNTGTCVQDLCYQVDCGTYGTCVNGNCVCESGYRGEYCDVECTGERGLYRFFGPAGFEAPVDYYPNGVSCVGDEASGYERCEETILTLPFKLLPDSSTANPECPETLSCDGARDNPDYAGLCNAFRAAANSSDRGDKILRVEGTAGSGYGGYLLPGLIIGSTHNGWPGSDGGYDYSSSLICNDGKWIPDNTSEASASGGALNVGNDCTLARQKGQGVLGGTCNHWRPAMPDDLNEIPRLIKQHCDASCFCPTTDDGLGLTRRQR